MNKEMIISANDHDTRVAILEEDQVVEIFIERERQRGVVGNIYKGRVSKVLPGMRSPTTARIRSGSACARAGGTGAVSAASVRHVSRVCRMVSDISLVLYL